MKTGIYGGTFSPPHTGHIMAAEVFMATKEFDELLVIPAAIPPHKSIDASDVPEHRLEMCRLAFGHIEGVTVSDIELKRGGKSYTVDTLTALSEEGRELFLLCGTDMIMTLDEWYRADEIFRLCTPVCVRRETSDAGKKLLDLKIKSYKKRFGVDVRIIDATAIEISSSEIRDAVLKGKDPSAYLSPAVEAYIKENGLYI